MEDMDVFFRSLFRGPVANPDLEACDVPTELHAEDVTAHGLLLTWKAPRNMNVAKYKISYSVYKEYNEGLHQTIKELPIPDEVVYVDADTTQLRADNLMSSTRYQFKITAVPTDETIKPAAKITVTTAAAPANLQPLDLDGIIKRVKKTLLVQRMNTFLDDGFSLTRAIARMTRNRINARGEEHITTRRRSPWSRGRLYCMAGRNLLLVPTNYPSVNHLNLEESTFECYYEFGRQLSPVGFSKSLFRERFAFEHPPDDPLVEDSEDVVLRMKFGDYRLRFFQVLTNMRTWCAKEASKKHLAFALAALMEKWDSAGYMKLLQSQLDSESVRQSGMLPEQRQFIEVLTANCDDSLFIVEAITKILRCCRQRMPAFPMVTAWKLMVSPYEHIFFRCHLQRAGAEGDSRYEVPRTSKGGLLPGAFGFCEWFADFEKHRVELMELSLELEDWEGYSNPVWCLLANILQADLQYFMNPALWPRKKDQLPAESYYSIEFYAAFTYVTLWASCLLYISSNVGATAVGLRPRELKVGECFKLLWRAIPTPDLPIEDMKSAVDALGLGEPFFSRFRIGLVQAAVEDEALWRTAASLFGDDLPSEFKPRTLQHLCRYAVRRRVRSPELIALLPVCEVLKRYLVLEF